MATYDIKLTDQIPLLTEETDTLLTGESTLADHNGVPLTFGSAYLTLMICRAGYAHMSLNFKPQPVRAGDILVLAEDTIALLKKHSRGFRVFFCLIPASFSAEIAYVLPNPLFLFLHEYPRSIPLPEEKPLLTMWLAQMQDITRNSPVYRHIMQRNHLQNLFLRIAERMPPYAPAATQKYSRKETLCWQFWELICRHSREPQGCAVLCAAVKYHTVLSVTADRNVFQSLSQITDQPPGYPRNQDTPALQHAVSGADRR